MAASEGIIRFALDKEVDERDDFTFSMFVSIVGLLILLVISPILAPHTSFYNYYGLFILYYCTSVLNLLFQQFVKGLDHIKSYAISGFIATASMVLSNIILLVFFDMGINGYLYSMIMGSALPATFLFFKEKLWQYFENISKIDSKFKTTYIKYCLPLIPNQISWWINNSSDKYIMNYFCGLSETGIYSIAYKIPSALSVVSTIFFSAWQISAIDDFGSNKSKKFFKNIYDIYFRIYALIATLIILFIRPLASLLFSNEFYNAWPYASILVVASMIQAMGTFYGSIYTSAMNSKMILISTLLAACINTGLNFLLIPHFGAYGAAIATTVGYLALLFQRFIDSRKIFLFHVNIKNHVVTYLLLTLQIIATCANMKFSVAISLGITTLLIAMNIKTISLMLKYIIGLIKKNIVNI